MAVEVTEDLVDGPTYTSGPNGIETTRVFLVEGITGNKTGKQHIAATNPKIPSRNQAHPYIAGLVVEKIDVQTLSTEQFRVTCTYKPKNVSVIPDEAQPAQISVGSTVQQVETNKDIKGDLMIVAYTKESFDEEGNVTGSEELTQTGKVSAQRPQVVASFSRREKNPPINKARAFVGTLNQGDFLGDPAGYWMCTRIEGTSSDGGKSYQVNYEFQRDDNQWLATVSYFDPETDSVPSDANLQPEAIKTFELYRKTEFSALNVGLVPTR